MSNTNVEKKQGSYSERLVTHILNSCTPQANREAVIGAINIFMDAERAARIEDNKVNDGIIGFGKYAGKHVTAVYALDPQYCAWLATKSRKFLSVSALLELDKIFK